ncbi:hypothetical protein Cni_G23547 [Canna indica]|uniref:WRKY domain-containing protein n=1 Tax=Canna indica TaxID=4628 RepID=A0AAQ3QJB7_9LILI|nr:hypothetical protein Cni_G23547 [Canna indica]
MKYFPPINPTGEGKGRGVPHGSSKVHVLRSHVTRMREVLYLHKSSTTSYSPHPLSLTTSKDMFLCLTNSKPKQRRLLMDDIFSQILDACKLAKDLDDSVRLSDVPIDLHYLLNSCEEIAGAFSKAAAALHSRSLSSYTSQMLFAAEGMDSDGAGAGEGSSRGAAATSSFIRAIDLLRAAPAAGMEDSNIPFFGATGGPSSLPEMPQLALEIQATAAMALEAFGGDGGGQATARLAVEGGSSPGRRVDGSSSTVQRASRKRKEGTVTTRVPALRTGNMDIPPDDGYTWRKYGQKDILNSMFPRSYYRCTHRSYYGCEAKKQVQRLDEDPDMFEVIYCGTHTCQTSPTPLLISTQLLPGTADDNVDSGNPSAMQPATSQPALRNWLGSNPRSLGSLLVPQSGAGGSRQGGRQMQGGRDSDCSVAEFADVMFNSGSSGSSMDVIFSPRQGN